MEKVSNYEVQRRQWQRRFLDMDHAALCRRLPELEETADQLRLWHFGRQFAVSREDGAIRCLSDDGPVSYNEQMNIYTLFHYCVPGARLTGEWLPFRDLRHASPFAPPLPPGTRRPPATHVPGRRVLPPAGGVRAGGGADLRQRVPAPRLRLHPHAAELLGGGRGV